MNRAKIAFLAALTFCIHYIFAQSVPFSIVVEPVQIEGLPGLQSYAYGQHEGKWLLIGGRLDGLHRRQPFASFDVAGLNTSLTVVDPEAGLKWSAPLSALPQSLQEQLSATNMEFHQDGIYLYLAGGYGYSRTAGDHITYPYLTAIKVPEVIQAIIAGKPFANHFRQINDRQFAVTGGYLNKIYDTYYLTGGQRFDGRYNPMGGPSFTQLYTNAIRRFTIQDDGTTLTVRHLADIIDGQQLHRRDYNVVPQILPNRQEGLTAFSGVFQLNADLPFLNCVNIDSSGYAPDTAFAQYYNHYHCAHLPLYSEAANEMHTLFFGGIAQYYEKDGILVQDNNVPFVKTIARVTRDASGKMAEFKLPVEMPAYLGASSEFIYAENLPLYPNGVLKMDELEADTTLAGYIYGGINSSAANIFFINTGLESFAADQLFKVYIVKGNTTGTDKLNAQSTGGLKMQIFPNPSDGQFTVKFFLTKAEPVKVSVFQPNGALLERTTIRNTQAGENMYQQQLGKRNFTGNYLITLEIAGEIAAQQIIIRQ